MCLLLAVLALILALALGVFRIKSPSSAAPKPEPPPPRAQLPDPLAATVSAMPATQDEPAAELNARFEAMHRLQRLALGSDAAPRLTSDASAHEEIASKARWTLASITDRPQP